MSRLRSNELARSGHTALGEHPRATNADASRQHEHGPLGPVPAENRPGHRPEEDQDKPVEAYAEFFADPPTSVAVTSDPGPAPDPGHEPATVAARLRLGTGFAAAERPDVIERLASLDHALAAFAPEAVELELSMKDRDRPGQSATLQCWVTGWPRLVATSSRPALTASLVEVRDDLRRQLDDAKARNAPQTGREQDDTTPPAFENRDQGRLPGA